MTRRAKEIFRVILSAVVICIWSHAHSQEESLSHQTVPHKQESTGDAPGLAVIIPAATKLSSRLAALESKVTTVLDVSEIEKEVATIATNLRTPAAQLMKLADSKGTGFQRFTLLRENVEQEGKRFSEISEKISKAIQTLDELRKEWLKEKRKWAQWKLSLQGEGVPEQVKSAFGEAENAIERVLSLILSEMEDVLKVQARSAVVQAQLEALAVQLNGLTQSKQRAIMLDKSPPIFSHQFFSQFGEELWYAVGQGIEEIHWPSEQFLSRYGWIILLQICLSLVLILTIHKNREALKRSERWRFLSLRPFSAGLFLGMMAMMWVYGFLGVPGIWGLTMTVMWGIALVRLLQLLNQIAWKNQFVYGLIFVFFITRLLYVFNLPLPLFRVYMLLGALAGTVFCLRWAAESRRNKDPVLYTWALRAISLYFLYTMIVQVSGKTALSELLFVSLIRSLMVVITVMFFMYVIRGGLEWLFRASPLGRTVILYTDADAMIRRAGLLLDVFIWGLVVLPALLFYWGVSDSFGKALHSLLAAGFDLGGQRISVGMVIVAAGILYGSLVISWLLQKLLMDEVLLRRQVEKGVRLSVGRLVHYVLVFAGFLLAFSILGFDFTKLTIILSALGVGIGFGLQTVVNNFVCGLILLFERPVRVGDMIEIDGKFVEIRRIGLRATVVQTFDLADVFIPNAELVANQVTNWTLSSRRGRLIVPVGVAYGSDVALVEEKLLECAKATPMLAKIPEPQVLFLNFGESSLDFELRVWVLDVGERLNIKSALHKEIDRRFREAKIEIAFPQRDLHLRSVDQSLFTGLSRKSGAASKIMDSEVKSEAETL